MSEETRVTIPEAVTEINPKLQDSSNTDSRAGNLTCEVDMIICRKYGNQKLAVDPMAFAIPISIPAKGGAMSR